MLEGIVKKPKSVIGIDCSTKTLAYGRFDNGVYDRCGEIFFEGNNLWERLSYIHEAIPPLVQAGVLKSDLIVFERAYIGNNPDVGLSLAYVYGAAIGSLMSDGTSVAVVRPLEWQSFIGNPNLTKAEKDKIKADSPGKSKSWYSNKGREIRKAKTLDWSRQFAAISSDSDNVGDAIAIGYYGIKNYHRLEYKR